MYLSSTQFISRLIYKKVTCTTTITARASALILTRNMSKTEEDTGRTEKLTSGTSRARLNYCPTSPRERVSHRQLLEPVVEAIFVSPLRKIEVSQKNTERQNNERTRAYGVVVVFIRDNGDGVMVNLASRYDVARLGWTRKRKRGS